MSGKRKTYEAKPEHRSKKYKQPILDLIGPDRTVCAKPMLKELLRPLGWVEAFRDSWNDIHCGFLASVCAPPLKFKFFQETCLDPMQLGPSVGASVRRRVATEISETADFACTQCRASQNAGENHGIASELVRTAFNTVDVARAEREAALRNTDLERDEIASQRRTEIEVEELLLARISDFASKTVMDGENKVERRKLLDSINADPVIFTLFLKDLFLQHEEGSWDGNDYTWTPKWRHPNSFRWETRLNASPSAYLTCPLCKDKLKVSISWKGASPSRVTWSGAVDHVLRHFTSKSKHRLECGKRYNQFFKAVHWNPRSARALNDALLRVTPDDPKDAEVIAIIHLELAGQRLEPDKIYYAGETPLLGMPVQGRLPFHSAPQRTRPPVQLDDEDNVPPPLSVEDADPVAPGDGMELNET